MECGAQGAAGKAEAPTWEQHREEQPRQASQRNLQPITKSDAPHTRLLKARQRTAVSSLLVVSERPS